ncbi:MAG: hypothetical protein ACREJO_00070 [Phycisphaerales bacterium]
MSALSDTWAFTMTAANRTLEEAQRRFTNKEISLRDLRAVIDDVVAAIESANRLEAIKPQEGA